MESDAETFEKDPPDPIIEFINGIIKRETSSPSTVRIFQPVINALKTSLPRTNFALGIRINFLLRETVKRAIAQQSIDPRVDFGIKFDQSIREFTYPGLLSDGERQKLTAACKAEEQRQRDRTRPGEFGMVVSQTPEIKLRMFLEQVKNWQDSQPKNRKT